MEEPKNNKNLIVGIAAIVLVVALIAGVTIYQKNSSKTKTATEATDTNTNSPSTTTEPSASSESPAPTPPATSTTTGSYKDGTYTAKGNYTSPGGQQAVTVSLTLANGVVTDSTVTNGATDTESQEYQNDFIGGYKALVTGKSIDSISLSRVSGSSLTSKGFNAAVSDIKTQAKA